MRIQDVTDEYNRRYPMNMLFDLYAQRDTLVRECKKTFNQSGFGSHETFSRWVTRKKLELEQVQHDIWVMEDANKRLDQMRDDLITLHIAKHGNYYIHSGN